MLKNGANYIYNNRPITYLELTDIMLMPDVGRLTLIDTESDGVYDSLIVNDYFAEGVIERIAAESVLELKDGVVIDFGDTNEVDLLLNGKETEVKNFREGMIVRIKRSINGDYICIDAQNSSVTGTIERIKSSGENPSVRINGNDYEYKIGTAVPSLGSKTTAYINVDNLVIYFEGQSDSTINYGYMYAVGLKQGMDSIFTCKMFTVTGAHTVLNASLDGVYLCSTSETGEMLKKKSTSAEVYSAVGGANFNRQLVKYKLNSKKELKELYLANSCEDFVKNFSANNLTYYTRTSVCGKYIFDDATLVFAVPADPDDYEGMQIVNYKYFTNEDPFTFEVFDTNEEDDTTAAVVVYVPTKNPDFDRSSGAVVREIVNMLDSDGVRTLGINLYKDGVEYTLPIADENLCGIDAPSEERWGYRAYPIKDLQTGDFIMYDLNSRGEINFFRKLYEVPTDITPFECCSAEHIISPNSTPYALIYIASGKVLRVNNASLSINPRNTDDPNYYRTFLIDSSRTHIYVYNRAKKEVRVGKVADIVKGEEIFIKMYKPYLDVIYVFE